MNIYEVSKEVEKFVLNSVNENTVQTNGVVGYCKGIILKYANENEARNLDGGSGYLFKYIYRNGQVELTPFS